MRAVSTSALCALAACVVIDGRGGAQAQTAPAPVDDGAAVDTDLDEIEEIIVRGRSFGDLRLEIRRLEEVMFARFNEINSTDDFDIECRIEKSSLRRSRSCLPSYVRELQYRNAAAAVRSMQNGTRDPTAGPQNGAVVSIQQARSLREVMDAEMRQLAAEDEQFREAVAELSRAQFALTLARGMTTMSR